MESAYGGRSKKLIWALEAQERYERPSCHTCNEKLQRHRGCKKPGFNIEGAMMFRTSSTTLPDKLRTLAECPVGQALRETPYIYDAINAYHMSDKSGLDILRSPPWLQAAFRIIGHEKYRLDLMAEADRQAKRDVGYTNRALGGGKRRG